MHPKYAARAATGSADRGDPLKNDRLTKTIARTLTGPNPKSRFTNQAGRINTSAAWRAFYQGPELAGSIRQTTLGYECRDRWHRPVGELFTTWDAAAVALEAGGAQ
jgi:hypothetical protein